jgi:hypothetical protein
MALRKEAHTCRPDATKVILGCKFRGPVYPGRDVGCQRLDNMKKRVKSGTEPEMS